MFSDIVNWGFIILRFYNIFNSLMSRSVIVHVWGHIFNDRIYVGIDSISAGIFHLVWSGLKYDLMTITFLLCLFRLYDATVNFRFPPHFNILPMLLGFINLVSNILEMLVSQSNNYFLFCIFFLNRLLFFIRFFVPFLLVTFLYQCWQLRIFAPREYLFPLHVIRLMKIW